MPSEPNETAALAYPAAAGTAWVALAFCLAVIGLLVANAVVARTHDPLAAEQIGLLQTELATSSDKDPIRAQIRKLDTRLREGFFTARQRAVQGTYLLAVGIAVFFISSHLAAKLRAQQPLPDALGAGRAWIDAALSLRSLTALGLVMAGLLLTLVVLARHDASAEYIRAVSQEAKSGSTALTGGAAVAAVPGGTPQAGPEAVGGAPPPPPLSSGAL
ncbi:MAG: hypothetical protein FJX74_05555, partial [Armatimonadetes bacterium]|nr:hypothetical protein [Armatimonadota bacterium]